MNSCDPTWTSETSAARTCRWAFVREVDGVDEQDAAVVCPRLRELARDGDDFVQQYLVDEVGDGLVLHHETGEHPGRVLEVDDPVATRCGGDVRDHPDHPGPTTAGVALERPGGAVFDTTLQRPR